MVDLEYPAMLYKRDGTMLQWDGEMFDHLIVNNADEAKAALSDGWSAGKPKKDAPKKDKPKAEEKEALEKDEGDLKALRAEYKKLSGKAPFNGWNGDALKARIAEFQKA
jgi:hypothetical protein